MSTEEASASSTTATSVPIVVTGNNVDLTEALTEYITTKIDRTVGKMSSSGAVMDCDVHLTVNKNPKVKDSHRVEVVVFMKGAVIRCAEDSPDMYASVDAVSDRLSRKLRRYKERKLGGWHGGPNIGENMADVVVEEDDPVQLEIEEDVETDMNVDPEAPVVTKIKSYDLSKPIALQEALFALDYIDHDFYVFRNEEDDDQINVVYKRNAGGLGLIQPSPSDDVDDAQ